MALGNNETVKVIRFCVGDLSLQTLVEFKGAPTVLEVATQQKGLKLGHSCGGMGTCGTCRILVLDSKMPLAKANSIESEISIERGFAENERLACQLKACDGLVLKIPMGSF